MTVGLNGREPEGAESEGGPVLTSQPEGSLEETVDDLKERGVTFPTEISEHDWGRWRAEGWGCGQLAFEVVRTETHKYVEYDNGDVEFYDLEADPYELESIHETADPGLVEDLKAKLKTLNSCSEDECREAEDAS